METLSIEKLVKGEPVQCEGVRIVPVARWSAQAAAADSKVLGFWIVEPIGIQVLIENERYALDLEGRRSEELAKL